MVKLGICLSPLGRDPPPPLRVILPPPPRAVVKIVCKIFLCSASCAPRNGAAKCRPQQLARRSINDLKGCRNIRCACGGPLGQPSTSKCRATVGSTIRLGNLILYGALQKPPSISKCLLLFLCIHVYIRRRLGSSRWHMLLETNVLSWCKVTSRWQRRNIELGLLSRSAMPTRVVPVGMSTYGLVTSKLVPGLVP